MKTALPFATDGRAGWPDWRHQGMYDYADRLPRAAWAWEFLRRNQEFQRDHAKMAPPVRTVRRRTDSMIVELSAARILPDTMVDSILPTRCIWTPRRHGSFETRATVRMSCKPKRNLLIQRERHHPFDLSAFLVAPTSCWRTAASSALSGRVSEPATRRFRPSVLGPLQLSVDALVPSRRLKFHLNALQCLNDLSGSGCLIARHFPPELRARRVRIVLQALDGRFPVHPAGRSPPRRSDNAGSRGIGRVRAAIFAIKYIEPSGADSSWQEKAGVNLPPLQPSATAHAPLWGASAARPRVSTRLIPACTSLGRALYTTSRDLAGHLASHVPDHVIWRKVNMARTQSRQAGVLLVNYLRTEDTIKMDNERGVFR